MPSLRKNGASRTWLSSSWRSASETKEERSRAFLHSEQVRSTRCRVAPTGASTRDWRRPPTHEGCFTVSRPKPLHSRLCCHAPKTAGPCREHVGSPGVDSRQRRPPPRQEALAFLQLTLRVLFNFKSLSYVSQIKQLSDHRLTHLSRSK